MKLLSVSGIFLMFFGILGLARQGPSPVTPDPVVQAASSHSLAHEPAIPTVPVSGGIAVIGAVAVLLADGRNSRRRARPE